VSEAANWIVWSNEHRQFWRPERCGYTSRIEQAGRYTKTEAETICNGANYRSNSDLRNGIPPEIFMPAPEAFYAFDAIRETLEEALEEAQADIRDRDHAILQLARRWPDFETAAPNETRPIIRTALAKGQPA
jgi:hypothetical protein